MKNLKYATSAFCLLPTLFFIGNKAFPDSIAFSLYNFAAMMIILHTINSARQLLICLANLVLLSVILLVMVGNADLDGMFLATLTIQAVSFTFVFLGTYLCTYVSGDLK